MRKEYNDRWNAVLVNQGITAGEYEKQRTAPYSGETAIPWYIAKNAQDKALQARIEHEKRIAEWNQDLFGRYSGLEDSKGVDYYGTKSTFSNKFGYSDE